MMKLGAGFVFGLCSGFEIRLFRASERQVSVFKVPFSGREAFNPTPPALAFDATPYVGIDPEPAFAVLNAWIRLIL